MMKDTQDGKEQIRSNQSIFQFFCRLTSWVSERHMDVTYCNFNNTLSFYLPILMH